MNKRVSLLILVILFMLPAVGHAARKDRAPKVAPSTPRQFTSKMAVRGAGSAGVTIVATAADEGRAMAAISKTLSKASTTASAVMNEIDEVNKAPRKQPVAIGEDLYRYIDACRTLSALTGGAFDITGSTSASRFSFVKRDCDVSS